MRKDTEDLRSRGHSREGFTRWVQEYIFYPTAEQFPDCCYPDLATMIFALSIHQLHFLKEFIHLFLERAEGREKEREKNIDVLETHPSFVPSCPQLGTQPATQACALTGNQTSNLWFSGRHSIHWATPTQLHFLNLMFFFKSTNSKTQVYLLKNKLYSML